MYNKAMKDEAEKSLENTYKELKLYNSIEIVNNEDSLENTYKELKLYYITNYIPF